MTYDAVSQFDVSQLFQHMKLGLCDAERLLAGRIFMGRAFLESDCSLPPASPNPRQMRRQATRLDELPQLVPRRSRLGDRYPAPTPFFEATAQEE